MEKQADHAQNEFDILVAQLSRSSKSAESASKLLKNYSDRLIELVQNLGPSNDLKLGAIAGFAKQMPGEFIPELSLAVRSPRNAVSLNAQKILQKMGPEGLNIALELIDDDDAIISGRGAAILRGMDEENIPLLRKRLSVEDPSKRALAVLMERDNDAITYFQAQLEEILGSSDQILSRYAIDAIQTAGDYATPLLLELLGDLYPFKQQNATNALIAMCELAVPDLVDELDNPIPAVQQNAMRALKEIGSDAAPALNDALESGSQLMVQNARSTLSGLKKTPKNNRLFGRFRKQ